METWFASVLRCLRRTSAGTLYHWRWPPLVRAKRLVLQTWDHGLTGRHSAVSIISAHSLHVFCEWKHGLPPVSYTHLDVYKRQQHTILIHRWLDIDIYPKIQKLDCKGWSSLLRQCSTHISSQCHLPHRAVPVWQFTHDHSLLSDPLPSCLSSDTFLDTKTLWQITFSSRVCRILGPNLLCS